MSADPSEGRERARPEFEEMLREAFPFGAKDDDLFLVRSDKLGGIYRRPWIESKWLEWSSAFNRGRRSLEQERDELRAQHRKVLLAIAANDLTTFRHGQKRRDGMKPSQAAEPGSIWNTPKEIAENALKHMELEDLARVHKGDS